MLQIVTTMYFRPGARLYSTVHRRVLYTNCDFLRADVVELPVGELATSDGSQAVSTATASVTEHLEAENGEGQTVAHVSTGGTELIDDLADVISFGLNAIFSRDRDLVDRLVGGSSVRSIRPSARMLFPRTFESGRFIPESEWAELRRFMTQLLALKRGHFEAAMRAIKRIVRATQHAVDDPTVAYVDVVAALESLTEATTVPAPTWDRLDGRKRKLIDQALEGADAEVAARLRAAIIEAERLGARSRFVAFVLDSVSPDYFRTEAASAVRPVRRPDLERVVKLAYDIRSRNVHVLEDLPPEAWVFGDGAETVSPPNRGIMLSHDGLARLACHVVRSYVAHAPAELDSMFDWRASLPGKVRVKIAPKYWIWNAEGFDRKSVGRYFSNFVAQVTDTIAERDEGVPDMDAVLERIEQLAPGTADGPAKTLMVAIYALWHRLVEPTQHRPSAASFLEKHDHLLQRLEIPSFVVGLLSEPSPRWTTDEWLELATERRDQRTRPSHLELPASLDAALQAIAAIRLIEDGRLDEARSFAAFAVEELPGNESLIAWEAGVVNGAPSQLHVRALVLRMEPEADTQVQSRREPEGPAAQPDPGSPTRAAELNDEVATTDNDTNVGDHVQSGDT